MPRKKKPSQTQVPGTERKRLPLITKAASKYAELRDERMELGLEEQKAQEQLIDLMDKAGETEYVDEEANIRVTVETVKRKAKVKALRKATEEEAAE